MDGQSIKLFVIAVLIALVCFNMIFFGYQIPAKCDNKMVLAKIENYQKLLGEKETKNKLLESVMEKNDNKELKLTATATTKCPRWGKCMLPNIKEEMLDDELLEKITFPIENHHQKEKEENRNSKVVEEKLLRSGLAIDKFTLRKVDNVRRIERKQPDDSTTNNDIGKKDNSNKKSLPVRKKKYKLKKFKGLKVDWWHDICMQRMIKEQTWHPLLPKYPQHQTRILNTSDDEKIIGSHFRRIYGYLYTKKSGYYDFKLMSRDGADFVLSDTLLPLKSVENVSNVLEMPEIMHLFLGRDTMDYQDLKLNLSEMFSVERHKVWLKANNLYFLELLQAGRFFAKYRIQWRHAQKPRRSVADNGYRTIGSNNLLYTNGLSPLRTPSIVLQKYKQEPRYKVEESEASRLAFYKTPVLHTSTKDLHNAAFLCPLHVQEKKKINYTYQGYNEYAENFLVYPKEHFDFVQTKVDHIALKKDKALNVSHQMFDKINFLNDDSFELKRIVHVVTNVDKSYKSFQDWKRNLYFVELDLQRKGGLETIRASHFVQLTPTGVCFMQDYQWNGKVVVNILTPIRNQVVWLRYLIEMLEGIVQATNEEKYRLILIDNNSTDGDYRKILQKSRLNHLYLNMAIPNFNKVKALNFGLQYVIDKNSIAFVLDLHLQLPFNIFDRIRKLTIQGKAAFSPSLLKLACGEHEQYTDLVKSEWLDYGTGMIAMYKSDWTLIKGYNEKLFGKKWGGEDWEVIDRLFQNGLYFIHLRLPRFYHIHHSKQGMWDGERQ